MRRQTTGIVAAAASLLAGSGAAAQEAVALRVAEAVPVEGRAPVIDGVLDEEIWASAPMATGFLQRRPDEGARATERTEVRFLYDGRALYIGARMYSSDPAAIQAPMSRRDAAAGAERLLVSLDTYLDRRTAYTFGVTAGGVRLDWYHPSDSEGATDPGFDPVWEARVSTDSLGWTAEMRIPFSQLRYTPGAEQRWGLNVTRIVPRRNEESYWVMVPRQASGWASRFGELHGIREIPLTRRVELLPYLASSTTRMGSPDPRNPFERRTSGAMGAGVDLKMGIGPSLTLEGTVNPDFGQVEADPAEVNLSAYETFFPERRPFFREGSQLLRGLGPTYFYSRRIGAAPFIPLPADHVDYPRTTRILGAAKLTGRLPGGTSMGALAALTDEAHARTYDSEAELFGRTLVVPRTAYGVFRAQQELRCHPAWCRGLVAPGSVAGLSFTAVQRDLRSGQPLAEIFNRRALTGGGDWQLRLRGGEYVLRGSAGLSHVEGDTASILRSQRSPLRYFQRPDAAHLEVDPTRTSLSGYSTALELARVQGRHWLWNLAVNASSPGREINDAGAMGRTDRMSGYAALTYRETRPSPIFRDYAISLSSENGFNYERIRTWGAIRSDANLTWRNHWRTDLTAWTDLRAQSDALTRGGPLMGTARAWAAIVNVYNDPSTPNRWNARVYYGESEDGEQTYRLSGGVTLRPQPRWELSVTPNYLRSDYPRQYITSRAGGPAETYGRRYIFSAVDRSELRLSLRLNYTFTPDLSFELFGEPYAASGRFYDFGELPAARSRDLRLYGTNGTGIEQLADGSYLVTAGGESFRLPLSDFTVRSLRSNAVLRWEWRPGSTLFVVWQQDRYADAHRAELVGIRTLQQTLHAPGDHVVAIKATYWIGR